MDLLLAAPCHAVMEGEFLQTIVVPGRGGNGNLLQGHDLRIPARSGQCHLRGRIRDGSDNVFDRFLVSLPFLIDCLHEIGSILGYDKCSCGLIAGGI